MAETPLDVERGLRELARVIDTGAPSAGLAAAVLERVTAEPVPARSAFAIALGRAGAWGRARLRWLVGALLALVGAGVVVSPVGAQVAEWFDFGGVVVSTDPGAPMTPADPEVPEATGGLTLAEAAEAAGFEPSVPAELGAPDRVGTSTERRLVSMSWRTPSGTLRLDQFEAELAPHFWKSSPEAVPVDVGSNEGIWFPVPHEVVLLDDDGHEAVVPPRLAAQTLIWVDGARTYRLEGDVTQARALEIAESVG